MANQPSCYTPKVLLLTHSYSLTLTHLLTHSYVDGGKQFERIPLSPKLPGEPISIINLGNQKAEMITSQGAIYSTENGGLNWKASVKETIGTLTHSYLLTYSYLLLLTYYFLDATLNRVSSSGTSGASFFTGKIANQIRDKNGNYIAVAARGNLFLTYAPGEEYWVPHNRGSSRRIQNMGFIQNDIKNGSYTHSLTATHSLTHTHSLLLTRSYSSLTHSLTQVFGCL